MAGLYNGHLLEFPLIRVDCFTASPPPPKQWRLPNPHNPHAPPQPAPNAQLFLLTHVHTDHLTGLTGDFTGRIICSPDTKRMLLRLEAENDRRHSHFGHREIPQRKYDGLRAKTRVIGGKSHIVDRIETMNYGETRKELLGYDEKGQEIRVSITLLDANHCPGSSMFLVTSPTAAVLHTGDVRADDLFLRNLRRIPALQEFFVPLTTVGKGGRTHRQLDRIYLDTSALFGADMPEREPVLEDLVHHMSLYPPDTVFFLGVTCFGWEYVVEEVARHFGCQVHVDRYKKSIYAAIESDPFLSACTTEDATATRFHACERLFRCSECDANVRKATSDQRLLVQVHMVQIKGAGWDEFQQGFLTKLNKAAAGDGPWPSEINVPLARHSLIPELQSLVKLFRPKSLSPNTLVPTNKGMDLFLLSDTFRDALPDEARSKMIVERDWWLATSPQFGPARLAQMKAEARATKTLAPVWSGAANLPPATFDIPRHLGIQDQLHRLLGSSDADTPSLFWTPQSDFGTVSIPSASSGVSSFKTEPAEQASVVNKKPSLVQKRKLPATKPVKTEPDEPYELAHNPLAINTQLANVQRNSLSKRPPKLETQDMKAHPRSAPSTAENEEAPPAKRFRSFAVDKAHLRALAASLKK